MTCFPCGRFLKIPSLMLQSLGQGHLQKRAVETWGLECRAELLLNLALLIWTLIFKIVWMVLKVSTDRRYPSEEVCSQQLCGSLLWSSIYQGEQWLCFHRRKAVQEGWQDPHCLSGRLKVSSQSHFLLWSSSMFLGFYRFLLPFLVSSCT